MGKFKYQNPVKISFGSETLEKTEDQVNSYSKRTMIVTCEKCDLFTELLCSVRTFISKI